MLPFYTAYRAAVRGKVEGLTLRELEVPPADREANRHLAQGHWLLALGELETPDRRPTLLLVGGLPGTGKSTLARELAGAGFAVLRSDEVRKELAGAPSVETRLGDAAYTPEWTERVYVECLRRAEDLLLAGRRVIVDANFRDAAARSPFGELAGRLAVPSLLVVCEAAPDVVCERLAARRGDASDADWSVYQRAAAQWQAPESGWEWEIVRVTTDEGVHPAADAVRGRLRAEGLLG